MRYFVEKISLRASTLEMERRLVHITWDEVADCVVTDAVIIELVLKLKQKQDEISKAEPRLRRVEISANIGERAVGLYKFLHIGQQAIPLKPVKSIIEL